MAVVCYATNSNNWDQITYTGAALSWSIKSPRTIHDLTYRYLRENTTPRTFHKLANGPPDSAYRKAVYSDPSVFYLQLPLGKDKPIYVALIWCGWKLGLNPVVAAHAISAAAAGGLALIIAWIMVREAGLAGIVLYPFFLIASGLFEAGRASTPDSLSALAVFSGLWLMRRDGDSLVTNLAFIFLLLAAWVRIDNLIPLLSTILAIGVFAAVESDRGPSFLVLAGYAILSLVTLVIIRAIFGGYGWKILIHYAFVHEIISPRDLTFRWAGYAIALRAGISQLLQFSGLVAMLMLATGALYLSAEQPESTHRRDAYLLAAAMMSISGHFLLFPMDYLRFFVAPYAFILLLGLIHVRDAVTRYRTSTV